MVIKSLKEVTYGCKVTNKYISRFNFLIFALMFSLMAACGGGGGSDGDIIGGGTPATVSGTAATGIAIDGSVNVFGSNGGSALDVPIGASGNYSVDVTGLTAPFFISAVPTNVNQAVQYSFAAAPGTANISEMTTLALFYANGGQNPASLINTWPANQANVSSNLANAQATVNANFVGVFEAISPALNIDFSTYDFFTTRFNIGDNFDQILDLLDVNISGGTPVINVDGNSFAFDPNIDTNGINIGGPGGRSMGLGSLTITGVDTSVIGSSYTPTIQTGSAGVTTSLVWGGTDIGQITVGGNGDQPILVTFNDGQLNGGQVVVYSYALNCLLPSDDCSNLQIDIANQQVIFNNLQLPLSGSANNPATGPVTLNGALKFGTSITPSIASFNASVSTISAGESVDLTAVFTNGTGVIDNNIGSVTSSSPVSVSPAVTTTYTLTVTNESGSDTSTVTVIVNPGGGSTDFGSLTVTGADTPVIRTSFVPRYKSGTLDWGRGNTIGDSDGTLHRLVATANSNQVSSVMYFFQDVNNINDVKTYSYSIDCAGGADCSKITLDLGAGTLNFNNVVLTISPSSTGNLETGPVTLDGTLNVQ